LAPIPDHAVHLVRLGRPPESRSGLHGPERAEEFRKAYEAEAGRNIEPWWDLHRLTGYSPEWKEFIPRQVAGRVAVDDAGMTARVEETIAGALRRL
jgi:hypothetical protein